MNKEILEVLKNVKYPGMSRDIVDFKMVQGAQMEDDSIKVFLKNIAKEEKFNEVKGEIEKLLGEKYSGKTISVELIKKDDAKSSPNPQANVGPKEKELKHIKHVIAVGSGKGGVGKSTVAVNLALATAKKGYKVGLMDADIWGPSVPTMMGTEDAKPFANDQKKILPIENHGIKMISIGYFLEKDTPVIWRGPLVVGALKQFMKDVEWPELDYLFIDMPPGTGDIQLTLAQEAKIDGIIIVTTPQKVSYTDAVKGIVMFQKLDIPIIGLVENMSYFKCPETEKKHFIFGEGGGGIVSKKHNVKLIGRIPIDPRVTQQGDEGIPVVDRYPDSDVSKSYFSMIEEISGYFNG